MGLRLEQAICLSLAGGLAVIAPPTFPRKRDPEPQTSETEAADGHAPVKPSVASKRSRNRSRRAS
jgi:hypothetical protein